MGARPTRYATPPPGRTHVWCRGLCMTGPDFRGSLLTMLLAVAIFVTQLGVSFPYLFPRYPALALPLLLCLAVAFIVTVWSAYLTSTTDPGILPRATTLPPSVSAFPAVRERTVTYNGRQVVLRFCDTCRIWRPPRTSHCATCNNCVRRFDHHCPWLGNDVGLRNYRSYFTFVISASIAAILAISTSALTLHLSVDRLRPGLSHAEAIRAALSTGATAVNIVLIILCFLTLLFTGGLLGFHIYLMCCNVTTAESFKKRARNSVEDADDYRGCRAIWSLQCTRRPQSAVTHGFFGPSYEHEEEFLRLIDEQVEMEKAVAPPARVHPVTSPIGSDAAV